MAMVCDKHRSSVVCSGGELYRVPVEYAKCSYPGVSYAANAACAFCLRFAAIEKTICVITGIPAYHRQFLPRPPSLSRPPPQMRDHIQTNSSCASFNLRSYYFSLDYL